MPAPVTGARHVLMRSAALALFLAAACQHPQPHAGTPVRPPQSPAARAIEEVRASAPFRECPGEACIAAALRACVPAHWGEAHYTLEGTPSFRDLFVVARSGGCRVVEYLDVTEDALGGCQLLRTECPDLQAIDGDRSARGCSATETVYRDERCGTPGR